MPNKSEILKRVDNAYELAHEAATARYRLFELLKNDEFSDADRLEALVLVKGIDPDDLTMSVGAIRRELVGDDDDLEGVEPCTDANSNVPAGIAIADGKYICPRWWGINPGEPVKDHHYIDAMSSLTNRIDGIGWLMLSLDSSDSDEASHVAGILVDLAQEAQALQNLWLHQKRIDNPVE